MNIQQSFGRVPDRGAYGRSPAPPSVHQHVLEEQNLEKEIVGEHFEAASARVHDDQIVLNLLNEALASKVISVLRYRRHYFMAQGLAADAIKKEFLLHAEQEQAHADQIAKRILELGGEPNFDPKDLSSRSHTEYAAGKDLENMIKEDLLAEHGSAESYREMTTYLANQDTKTRQLLSEILASEVEQAEELSNMLGDLQCLLSLWRPGTSSNKKTSQSLNGNSSKG